MVAARQRQLKASNLEALARDLAGSLLRNLYDDSAVAEFAREVARLTNSASSQLIVIDQGSGDIDVLVMDPFPSFMQQHYEDYFTLDPYENASKKKRLVTGSLTDSELVPSQRYFKSVFFNEYIAHSGYPGELNCWSIGVHHQAHTRFGIGVPRGHAWHPLALDLLNHIAPSLTAFGAARGREKQLRATIATLHESLETHTRPTIHFRKGGRIESMGRAASEILAADFLPVIRRQDKLEPRADIDRASKEKLIAALSGILPAEGILIRCHPAAVSDAILVMNSAVHRSHRLLQIINERHKPTHTSAITHRWQLTQRERDVLELIATGASNSDIAEALGISINTVKYHLKNLYAKTGTKRRTGLVSLYNNLT